MPTRCPCGTRRNKKTGNCEPKPERKRCPNGTRKNKRTGRCEQRSNRPSSLRNSPSQKRYAKYYDPFVVDKKLKYNLPKTILEEWELHEKITEKMLKRLHFEDKLEMYIKKNKLKPGDIIYVGCLSPLCDDYYDYGDHKYIGIQIIGPDPQDKKDRYSLHNDILYPYFPDSPNPREKKTTAFHAYLKENNIRYKELLENIGWTFFEEYLGILAVDTHLFRPYIHNHQATKASLQRGIKEMLIEASIYD